MSFSILSFIRRATNGAVPVADDQPLPTYQAIPPAGSTRAGGEYEAVGVGTTASLGSTGAIGDWLSHVVFQPQTTTPGACQILDNAVVVYDLPAPTLTDLRPIIIPVNAYSVSGAWKVTTGANMKAAGFGDFT